MSPNDFQTDEIIAKRNRKATNNFFVQWLLAIDIGRLVMDNTIECTHTDRLPNKTE